MSLVLAIRRGIAFLAFGCAAASAHATPVDTTDHWVLAPTLSASHLDNGRDDWRGADLDVLYKASPSLRFGGDLERRQRGARSDTLGTVSVSANPSREWEWHGALSVGPGADFSARRGVSAGTEWRVSRTFSLLLDYRHLHFNTGSVHEIRPGVIVWFGDTTWMTLRYADGKAFGTTGYQSRLLRLDHIFAGQDRLTLVYAHGADPERDPQLLGVLLTTADLYAVTLRIPINRTLALVVGADYEDRKPYYTRTGALLGVAIHF
ncbi:MAG: YaiO family outer membrane beta-barrel protein [Luteimonas sp.]